jgi:hypothetical protein
VKGPPGLWIFLSATSAFSARTKFLSPSNASPVQKAHAAAAFFLRELGVLWVKQLYRSIKPFPLKSFR